MTSLIVVGAIALFVLITVLKGVRIVPQGEEWIVERLGRYHSTLKPGLNIVIPYMDVVAYRLPTKDIILDVQQQEIITKDNAVIVANALCFAKVVDPQKASYGVQDFSFAVTSLTMTSLRAIVGAMDLDEALSSREQIKARLRDAMSEQTEDWGVTVRSVEIQDIKPSENMQLAMERQAAAERERKADVTRAEGAKQAAILEAEARLQARQAGCRGADQPGRGLGALDFAGEGSGGQRDRTGDVPIGRTLCGRDGEPGGQQQCQGGGVAG